MSLVHLQAVVQDAIAEITGSTVVQKSGDMVDMPGFRVRATRTGVRVEKIDPEVDRAFVDSLKTVNTES